MSPLKERVRQALHEEVVIVPYDRCWAARYRREAARLRRMFGSRLIRRIEHFGSTAVPGLAAKPIIDMLVEVPSLRAAKLDVAPVLCAAGYEYFWRPTFGDNVPPWYAFFIKRNRKGERTHHIHMVTCPRVFQEHWDRLLFRDYLVANPKFSRKYANLKRRLANEHPKDRVAYTRGKTAFIERVMRAIRTAEKKMSRRAEGAERQRVRYR